MSPVCQLEMTLPREFPGGVWGDGSADERWGAAAARGAAGFGSAKIDGGSGGAAARARAASSVSAVEGLSDQRRARPDLETTRSPQQPAQARGVAACGSDDHPPVVLGFWPDFGGREVARGSWGHNSSGNAAPVDDRSRAVARSQATQTHPPTAAAARVCWRAGSGRRQRALVVRGSRTAMHFAGVCRRRDQPTDASAICRERVDLCLFPCGPRLSGGLGQAGCVLQRQAGVSRVSHPGALGSDRMTQFGRALPALNIDIICANSSPAKGRVERANKTLQDRLLKELRLAGAATVAEGNAFLPAFIADYNARFAKAPVNHKDLHRPLRAGDDLDDAFAWKEERTLSRALTLQYDKVMFILEPSEQAKAAIGKPRRRSASG